MLSIIFSLGPRHCALGASTKALVSPGLSVAMRSEVLHKVSKSSLTDVATSDAVKRAIAHGGWEHDKARKFADTFFIGKGKSAKKHKRLWSRSTALP